VTRSCLIPNQTAVVDFGFAVNRRWTGQDGSNREETCFVDCRAFGRLAENINKYMSKGRPLFIEGRLTFDSWTAQDGTRRSRHRVTVENFQFLPGGAGAGGAGVQGVEQTKPGADRAAEPAEQQGPDNVRAPGSDDIPF